MKFTPTQSNHIKVIQHNCVRSMNVMHSCLNSATNTADVVLLQEPWIVRDHKTTISHSSFTSLLSPSNLDIRPRTMAFISKIRQNLVCTPRSDISKNSDLQVLSISANGISSILVLNIYNEKLQQDNNDQWIIDRGLTAIQLPSRAVICEDFNAHHA